MSKKKWAPSLSFLPFSLSFSQRRAEACVMAPALQLNAVLLQATSCGHHQPPSPGAAGDPRIPSGGARRRGHQRRGEGPASPAARERAARGDEEKEQERKRGRERGRERKKERKEERERERKSMLIKKKYI